MPDLGTRPGDVHDGAAPGVAAPLTLRDWLLAAMPVGLLVLLVGLVTWSGPADALRAGHPPVERLTFQRVVLEPGTIVATVMNDGPDPVAIAQVQVDDAFWTFAADQGQTLTRLGRTSLTIPYPWVEGETHVVRVLTSTGMTFEHEIPVAVETPVAGWRTLGTFALIGIYVGVLPVAIGLLWFPFMARMPAGGMDFVLALTVGLLVFLLVDGAHDGAAVAAGLPASFQGPVLFAMAAVAAWLVLEAVGRTLQARRVAGGGGWLLAVLVAVGIGLHNFGEGLAIGSAFALGEAALGTLLIVGFMLHNTTEGVAIVAPLARERRRVGLGRLAQLGLIGGAPTIAGAWLGGLVYSPVWSVVFLGLGVGAIAQVVVQIARQMGGIDSRTWTSGPVLAGLAAGVVVMYVTGMLVG